MIKNIYISNYAIIDKLEISFDKGFNVITGETGAGKSILLGALGLIMGSRADKKVLFDPDKKSIIEAKFDISEYDFKSFFIEQDLDYENELIIRREISNKGSSRIFVNDTPAKLNVLKSLGDGLIDMHRQFDMLDIHNRSFQMNMLDTIANNNQLLSKYRSDYRNYQSQLKKLSDLKEKQAASINEMDFLKFQLEELHEVVLDPIEIKQNEIKLELSSNAEEIKTICYSAYDLLTEQEHSLVNQLLDISNKIHAIAKFDPEISSLHERLENNLEELRDISSSLAHKAENTQYNEEDIQLLQEQIDNIYKLQQKHRVNDIESLIDIQTTLEEKLSSHENLDEEILAIEKSISKIKESLQVQADKISKNRIKSSPKFEKSVTNLLGDLSMNHAKFKVDINTLGNLGESGIDEVNYLFSANKGHQLQLLKEVASGGEISRLTLCIKSLVAKSMSFPTLIFDEIDAGISGAVANKMAAMLKELATNHQIITITHSPQIASKGDRHYYIYKDIVKGQTKTNMKTLDHHERITEIAQMLSGNPPTPMAIENAKELLS